MLFQVAAGAKGSKLAGTCYANDAQESQAAPVPHGLHWDMLIFLTVCWVNSLTKIAANRRLSNTAVATAMLAIVD